MFKLKECGTHGRKWYTSKKGNIAFSFYIETNCNIKNLDGVTIEIANTVVQVFKELYNIILEIKHPNDIVYNEKKLGGILTQSKQNGEIVKFIVVGIGFNTNQKKEDFDDEIKNIATSIRTEFNIKIDNKKVIKEFCNLFESKIKERIS